MIYTRTDLGAVGWEGVQKGIVKVNMLTTGFIVSKLSSTAAPKSYSLVL